MAKQRKAWMPGPATKPKSSLPGTVKDEVDTKARELIESVLKPKHLQPPPEGSQLNCIVDITIKWLGSKCYFVSIYRTPSQEAFGGAIRPDGICGQHQIQPVVHAAHRPVG